jgi:eukaryotic-like serine/threonine-protein kinase
MTSHGPPNSTPQPPSDPDGRPGPGSIVAEKFELIKLVGQGGMGSVWTAKHLSLGIEVALKFIDIDTPELRSRFAHEAQAVARIQSPHVVQVHDFGNDEAGRPYIAMELLLGEELGVLLDREGRMALPVVDRVVAQAAKGLGKAHQAGVVHRDIKPDNIFLVPDDDGFLVKLLDFGIAKIDTLGSAVHHKTTTGSLMGTPLFMSPEQVLGSRKLDNRSDLYSLAVVAYRAITGTVPHDAPALGELIVNISTKPAPPPSTYVPVPPTLDAFFERALAKDADHRFGTAREMADAFSLACRGESFSHIPPPAPSQPDFPGGVLPPESSATMAVSALLASSPSSTTLSASLSNRLDTLPAPSPAPSRPVALSTREDRPLFSSTAHAQTLPNIAAPPPASNKSWVGIALALIIAAGSIAVAVMVTREPPPDEHLAKSNVVDGTAPSVSASASGSASPSLGIPDPSSTAAAPPAVTTPPVAHPPVKGTVTTKKKTTTKKSGTTKTTRSGHAYPL